jgi:hypothetical protein
VDKCLICATNNADKKNAHLIPWFLIKNNVTKGGTGIRDMELSFSLNPDSFTQVYTGRSILPETIDELGQLNDLQKEKENPYSRDNIICTACEEKLSRLEAIFSSFFTEKKINNVNPGTVTLAFGNPAIVEKGYEHSLYELFLQSIFLRCSIGRFKGFKLNGTVENKIRENLKYAFLIERFTKIKPDQKVELKYRFPLITASLNTSELEDPTELFIVPNLSSTPYFIVAGKWLFQLYEKEQHLLSSNEWMYGLQLILKPYSTYPIVTGLSHVIVLEKSVAEKLRENMVRYFAERKIDGIKKNIRELYLHIFKRRADIEILQYIYNRYFFHFGKSQNDFDSMINAFLDLRKMI